MVAEVCMLGDVVRHADGFTVLVQGPADRGVEATLGATDPTEVDEKGYYDDGHEDGAGDDEQVGSTRWRGGWFGLLLWNVS